MHLAWAFSASPSFERELPPIPPLPFSCPSSPAARLSGTHARTHALPWARSAPRCVPAPLPPGLPAGRPSTSRSGRREQRLPGTRGHGLRAAVEPANTVGSPKPPQIWRGSAGGRKRRRRGATPLCLGVTGAGTEPFSSPTPSGCACGLGCPGDCRRAVTPSPEKRHPRNPAG